MTTNRSSNLPDDDHRPPEPMGRLEFDTCISEYVARQLSDREQARFEEALLANPEWAQWVAAERPLREGIGGLARSDPELFRQEPPGYADR